MKRNPEMVAHHEWNEDRTRRLEVFGHVQGHRDRNRRDFSAFDGALNQRDALMADRSGRGQQHHVGMLLLDGGGDVLRERALEPVRVHVVANE